VVAPELGLPGRFRAVTDARLEGVELRLDVAIDQLDPSAFDTAVLVARGPIDPPDLGPIPIEVIGDASGTGGLFSALDAARAVALTTGVVASRT